MSRLILCPVCGNEFKAPSPKSVTCSVPCRQKYNGRRAGAARTQRMIEARGRTGRRCVVLLRNATTPPGPRLGTIDDERVDRGRPLLTVRLDVPGWPGGRNDDTLGWFVDLREDEVIITDAPP